MKLRDLKSTKERQLLVEKQTNTSLSHIGNFSIDEKVAGVKNCENMIGTTQVPLGIAGPLALGDSSCYIPLATTEGALVASVSRGCKAVTESGGVSAFAYRTGVTRAPVFHVPSWEKVEQLSAWIEQHKDKIKKVAEETSSHLEVVDIEKVCTSPYVFLRMRYDTKDAMGMNMVTIASEKVVALIEKEVGVRCISLSGNVCVDKKPSWRNFISHRGWMAGAEIEMSKEVLEKTLKTNTHSLYEVWVSKCMVGSAMSGSMGSNAHHANILAALFIATGQDAAHVAECSGGITICEVRGDSLFISIQLPNLMVGTVGGGTGLETQKEALSIMSITKQGQTEKFARIAAAAVLAGELSLLASLSEGTLAKAHKKLAR